MKALGNILITFLLLLSFPQISGAISNSVDLTVTQGLIPWPYDFDFAGPRDSWWYFRSDSDWIRVASGWWQTWPSHGTMTIYPDYNHWETGMYNGTVTAINCGVEGTNADGSFNIVCSSTSTLYTLEVIPPNISVNATSFDAEVTDCLSQSFDLTVKSTGSMGFSYGSPVPVLRYHIVDYADWIAPMPYADFQWGGVVSNLREGDTGVVHISTQTRDWSIGETHTGTVHISSGDTFFNIPVTLTVVAPKLSVNPNALYLEVREGEVPPLLTLSVTNAGNKGDGWLYYWVSDDKNWMSTTLSGFRSDRWYPQPHLSDGETGTVTVDFASGLPEGLYNGTIYVGTAGCPYKGGQGHAFVPVILNVTVCEDKDGDGFKAKSEACPDGKDCNDDPEEDGGTCYPGATELCDGRDNDCDDKKEDFTIEMSHSYVAPQQTSGNTTADVKLMLVNPPAESCNVKMRVEPVPKSGGHDHHDASRPHGKLDGSDEKTVTVSGSAEKRVSYESSEIAGTEKIKAKLIYNGVAVIKKEKTIDVKLPMLGAMPGGSYWNLVGGVGVASKHADNHNAEASVIDSMKQIAYEYYLMTGESLDINDMSLEWGGAFDLCNLWNPAYTCTSYPDGGHSTHRGGTDVDVRSRDMTQGQKSEFKKIVCKKGGFPKEHGTSIHWHIYFHAYIPVHFDLCGESTINF